MQSSTSTIVWKTKAIRIIKAQKKEEKFVIDSIYCQCILAMSSFPILYETTKGTNRKNNWVLK